MEVISRGEPPGRGAKRPGAIRAMHGDQGILVVETDQVTIPADAEVVIEQVRSAPGRRSP